MTYELRDVASATASQTRRHKSTAADGRQLTGNEELLLAPNATLTNFASEAIRNRTSMSLNHASIPVRQHLSPSPISVARASSRTQSVTSDVVGGARSSCSISSGRQVVYGICLSLCGAVCLSGAVVCLRRSLYHRVFYAPFFVTYFITLYTLLVYPVYAAVSIFPSFNRTALREITREAVQVFRRRNHTNPSPPNADIDTTLPTTRRQSMSRLTRWSCHVGTLSTVVGKWLTLTAVWSVVGYTVCRGTAHIDDIVDIPAMFTTNVNVVYVMSWVFLQNQFVSTRIVAFIASMTGAVMLLYRDIDTSPQIASCSLILIANAFVAVFKVVFRLFFGDCTNCQTAFCLSVLGVVHTVTTWPLLMLFHFCDWETFHAAVIRWADLCATTAFIAGLTVLVMCCWRLTSSDYANCILAFSIPITAVVEAIFGAWQFSRVDVLQIVAYSLCAVGFGLNMLPSNWFEHALSVLGVRSRDVRHDTGVVTSMYQRARRATFAHVP